MVRGQWVARGLTQPGLRAVPGRQYLYSRSASTVSASFSPRKRQQAKSVPGVLEGLAGTIGPGQTVEHLISLITSEQRPVVAWQAPRVERGECTPCLSEIVYCYSWSVVNSSGLEILKGR